MPDARLGFDELLDGFLQYYHGEQLGQLEIEDCRTEVAAGRTLISRERRHLFLYRPSFLHMAYFEEDYLLVFCRLPETVIEAIADLLVLKPGLRHRLTLCDLESAQKINLTRNALFVHFERYLRRVHGLRLGPAPALTQALVDRGLLSLDKG